jgi:MscS family membrane protein
MTGLIESLNISTSPYINALISLLLFVAAAKALDFIIDRILRKLTRFTKSDIDDKIMDVIHKPVYFTVILIGVIPAVEYLKPSEKIIFYSFGTLHSLIALIWTVAVIKISNIVIENTVDRVSDATGLSKDLIPLIENVSRAAIIVAGLMVILSIWEINITPLLASAGIAGAAVAFAAKDTLANFFGGISVFADKPFKIGDYIVLDRGERGEVVSIGVRSTRIKTRDDILITVPNSIIANTKIINESAPVPNFRMRVPVSVAYGSDIDLVGKTLLEAAHENENILKEPEPRVRFREFGESGLHFELLCWAKEPAMRGLTAHELNSAIYRKFNKLSIIIPFPQRDVHVRHKGHKDEKIHIQEYAE